MLKRKDGKIDGRCYLARYIKRQNNIVESLCGISIFNK